MNLILPTKTVSHQSLAKEWEIWRRTPVDPRIVEPPVGRHQDAYRRVVGRFSPEAFESISAAILRYDVFPSDLGASVTSLSPERPRLQLGDTVMFCWNFLAGVKFGFGCRVSEVFWDDHRRGFSYQTLVGHPELGEETFEVHRTSDDLLVVTLSCWSCPGTWLCRLTYPLARHWQVQGARRILDHLESKGQCPMPSGSTPRPSLGDGPNTSTNLG